MRLDALPRHPLAQVVAETLHVTGGERSLVERLAGADTVLLLDSCEHLVEERERSRRLDDWTGPRPAVLATSQVPLGLDGERRLRPRAALASRTR